jgi:hypothetical protein
MPNIKGKKFPYTAKGKKDAMEYEEKVPPMPIKGKKAKKKGKYIK